MNPMRVTAIVMIVLGGIIAAFAVVGLASAGGTATADTTAVAPSLMTNPWVLFPFATVAVLGGVGILMFGGKGVIRTRDPAVRR